MEVAHEALIRSWPQLRKWIDADRAGLRTRTRVTEATRDWKNAGRDPTYLYSGARLAVAEEWAALHLGELSIDEAEFLRCSREVQKQQKANELAAARKLAEEQKQRAELSEQRQKEQKDSVRKLRNRATATTGVAAAAALLLVMSLAAMWRAVDAQHSTTEEQARIAESRRLAAESASALVKYPQCSSLLAVEALS